MMSCDQLPGWFNRFANTDSALPKKLKQSKFKVTPEKNVEVEQNAPEHIMEQHKKFLLKRKNIVFRFFVKFGI